MFSLQKRWPLMGFACLLAWCQVGMADPGLTINTSAMLFIYTQGGGGAGSIGRIDIAQTDASSLIVQEVNLGSDNVFGGGNDTVVDLAQVNAGQFNATFSADVYYLGTPNSYAIIGTYAVSDATGQTVVEGDFRSQFAGVGGQTLFIGGDLTNSDGILRPGGTSSWDFVGDSSSTSDYVNGVFGGRDGIDGNVSLADLREYSTMANLFEFQFVGRFPDLDAFFNSGIQASQMANLKVTAMVTVPAPGAALLGMMGLLTVIHMKRRLNAGSA